MKMEICKLTAKETDEAIAGLDSLQAIIVPILTKLGTSEHDAKEFKKHIKMAKHALVAMGQFMEQRYE